MTEETINGANGALWTRTTHPIHGLSPKGVLICAHGGPGGDHRGNDSIFDDLANDAKRSEIATIQFDFYGCGQSDGKPSAVSLKTQQSDLASILSYVRSKYACPFHLVGESMGCTPIAMIWPSDAKSFILLWPAFDLRDTDLSVYIEKRWADAIASTGHIEDNGIIIGGDLYNELTTYNYEPLFNLPPRPVMIVHGREDKEVPFRQSIKAATNGNGYTRLHLSQTAGHGFRGTEHRADVASWVKAWLDEHS